MLRSTAQGAIVGVARLSCAILAFVTPVLLDAGPVALYSILSAIVALGMFIGWLCFHRQQRNEFSSEGELVMENHSNTSALSVEAIQTK